jgi:hypothetical protein
MRKSTIIAAAALALLALGCCKSATGPSAETLEGTWTATRAEYVKVADSNVKVDVVAEGSTVTLQLSASAFTFTANATRVPQTVMTGTWSSSTDTLTLAPTGVSFTNVFEMALNGSTLNLDGGGTTFDFSGTRTFEDASLSMTLAKS